MTCKMSKPLPFTAPRRSCAFPACSSRQSKAIDSLDPVAGILRSGSPTPPAAVLKRSQITIHHSPITALRFATHIKTGFVVTHRKQTTETIPVRNNFRGFRPVIFSRFLRYLPSSDSLLWNPQALPLPYANPADSRAGFHQADIIREMFWGHS